MNGDDEEDEEGEGEGKGVCTYPPEFPVGKTVFLENDRRRAGWIPAVVGTPSNMWQTVDMCSILVLLE